MKAQELREKTLEELQDDLVSLYKDQLPNQLLKAKLKLRFGEIKKLKASRLSLVNVKSLMKL